MPRFPIRSDELLEVAESLVPANPFVKRYTAHRRAVSTAYYAVFHAVGERVALQVFPTASDELRVRVRRWVAHSDVKTVATWVGQTSGTIGGTAPRHIAALSAGFVDQSTRAIADGFLELHEKREDADYDHASVFTRADALGLLALARETVDRINGAASDEAAHFFGLIAMQARIQAR